MNTRTEHLTEQIRTAWDALAPGFDRHTTPHTMRYGEQILNEIAIGPGARFLDVAAGSGALALPAARRGARVVAVDIAPAMVERLAARAREEGLERGLAEMVRVTRPGGTVLVAAFGSP